MNSNASNNCIHRCNVVISNIFNLELQLINTKLMIKNKLKELLSELKKFKVQAVLVLDYKKRNDCKFFHSSAKLVIQTLMKYLNSCIKAFSQKKKLC